MATKRKKSEAVDQSAYCVAVGGTSLQRGFASRPRALRGKRGGLKDMLNMPVDIGFEICSHLDPLDLLQLARTSKPLRTLLMSRTSRFLWRSARSHIDGLPDCPPYLSEPAYANLVFSAQCYNCMKKNAKAVLWKFAVRYCKSCKETMTVSGSYKKWREREFTDLWSHRELLNSMKRSCQTPLYHIPQIEQLALARKALERNESALKHFEEEQIARVEAFDKHAQQCQAWEKEKSLAREIATEEIREQRTDEIHERLEQLDLGRLRLKLWRLPRELVYKPKPLTERDWEKILDKLLIINSREAVYLPVEIPSASCSGNANSYSSNFGDTEDIWPAENSVYAQPFGYMDGFTESGAFAHNGDYINYSEENGAYGENALYVESSFQAEGTPQFGYFDYADQVADYVEMHQDNEDNFVHIPPVSDGAAYAVGIQDDLPLPISIPHALHTSLHLFLERHTEIQGDGAAGYVPHFADIALTPAFKEMIRQHNDGDIAIKEIQDCLPDIIRKWERQVRRELQALLMAAIGTTDLELAVAFFECTRCKTLLTHHDAVAHACMRLSPPSHDSSEPGRYEDEVYHLTGQYAWTSEELRTATIVPRIRDIIRMCGKDPDYTVRLRMDIADTRLCCHPPDDPEHKLFFTWRSAIEMEHARISGLTESIEQLTWRPAYFHEEHTQQFAQLL